MLLSFFPPSQTLQGSSSKSKEDDHDSHDDHDDSPESDESDENVVTESPVTDSPYTPEFYTGRGDSDPFGLRAKVKVVHLEKSKKVYKHHCEMGK